MSLVGSGKCLASVLGWESPWICAVCGLAAWEDGLAPGIRSQDATVPEAHTQTLGRQQGLALFPPAGSSVICPLQSLNLSLIVGPWLSSRCPASLDRLIFFFKWERRRGGTEGASDI